MDRFGITYNPDLGLPQMEDHVPMSPTGSVAPDETVNKVAEHPKVASVVLAAPVKVEVKKEPGLADAMAKPTRDKLFAEFVSAVGLAKSTLGVLCCFCFP